ncbi:hypothetical protein DSO57_1004199 [Entomophthora muscae]|uniref:Uncharacterized protein n=1 Tax=Entomophthora muscae TaxID=34485 RepID=A0ACC2RMZ6_9FUNG|nr:hypothetical protein DSO57_1004199 [Entomophthora muscae]
MEPPVTPRPMPASSLNLPTNHTGKLFGIVYITLTGVIDTIIPAAGLWFWKGKSVSYLFKLAPLLWWAFPAKKSVLSYPLKMAGQLPKTGSLKPPHLQLPPSPQIKVMALSLITHFMSQRATPSPLRSTVPRRQRLPRSLPLLLVRRKRYPRRPQRTLPLPLLMALPPPSFDSQDEPEEYSKKFKASGHVVNTQQLGEYLSKIRYQVGNLESCERRHNGVDRHHSSEDLGVYIILSEITGKIHKYVVTQVYIATDWVEWSDISVGQEYCSEEFSCAGSL